MPSLNVRAREVLICITAVAWVIGGLANAAPWTPPNPRELDIPYSPDNPPGPTFTDEEKQRQLAEGQRIRGEIIAAFKAGRESYTIPAGDYRFDAVYRAANGNAFTLEGLRGSPEKPFRILGQGATFWFNLSEHPVMHYHQMIKIFDCSHITLEGLTVDSDPRGCMDARITAFDFQGNRIQVKPVAGTRLIDRMPHESRFLPYKANGNHLASLHQIDQEWGVANFMYERFERTADGLYWFTMKNSKLLDTARSDAWRAAYGPEGTLEIGDMLGFVYSGSGAINLLNCKQITVRDCRFHAAKAGTTEQGGYGDHRWINCYFMARPGTNNLLGGDGVMSSCMHGSTFDGRVVQRTTDDCFNSYGRYHHAESVTERSITFRKDLPPELGPGHVAQAYSISHYSLIGRLTVESVEGKTVTFREPVGEQYATVGVMFPEFQNADWVIRNSIFSDCYQRVRLCCGPGTFENNRVERVGGGLTIGNGKAVDTEGGLPSNVVIRNNVFVDTAVAPPTFTIYVKCHGHDLENLEVSGNLICNSGSEAVHVNRAKDLMLRDNILINPAQGQALLPESNAPPAAPAAFGLKAVHNASLVGNVIFQGPATIELLRETECEGISLEGNRLVSSAPSRLDEMVRGYTEKHDLSAAEIIARVRAELALTSNKQPTP